MTEEFYERDKNWRSRFRAIIIDSEGNRITLHSSAASPECIRETVENRL